MLLHIRARQILKDLPRQTALFDLFFANYDTICIFLTHIKGKIVLQFWTLIINVRRRDLNRL